MSYAFVRFRVEAPRYIEDHTIHHKRAREDDTSHQRRQRRPSSTGGEMSLAQRRMKANNYHITTIISVRIPGNGEITADYGIRVNMCLKIATEGPCLGESH